MSHQCHRWLAIASYFFALSGLSACQPNPESVAVQGKNHIELESKIEENALEHYDITQIGLEREYKTERYEDFFSGADQKVKILVDAEVISQTGEKPVIRVKPHSITIEDVKKWSEVLLEGQVVYEPKVGWTKSELEKEILRLKNKLNDEQFLLEYYEGDAALIEEVKESYQSWIAAYEKEYETAPESYDRKETDWTFHPFIYYKGGIDLNYSGTDTVTASDTDEAFMIEADVDGYVGIISAQNVENNDFVHHRIYFQLATGYDEEGILRWNAEQEVPITKSEEEILEMVETKLDQMGLSDRKLFASSAMGKAQDMYGGQRQYIEEGQNEGIYQYSFSFIPTYFGMDVIKQKHMAEKGEDSYSAFYDYETLTVTVANDRIVSIQWRAPLEVINVESANVETLSFEEAKELFKSQMQTEYTIGKLSREAPTNSDYAERVKSILSGEIHIDKVIEGLVRIQIPNQPNEYRLVLAWSFQGEESLDTGSGYSWREDQPAWRSYSLTQVYQTINAIDGSFIDVMVGY